MPKKRRRSPKGRSSSGRSGHPGRRAAQAAEQELALARAVLEDAASSDVPWPLLELASVTLDDIDPRNRDPFARSGSPEDTPEQVVRTLLAHAEAAPAVLALALAHLADEPRLVEAAAAGLRSGGWPVPAWVARLDQVELVAAAEVTDAQRAGYEVMLHARVAGHDLTLSCYVDFELGGVVTQALLVPDVLEVVTRAWWERAGRDEESELVALPVADAAARLRSAIETGARMWPPAESEEWPDLRPLLEWLLRHAPADGQGFDRPEWSGEDRAALAQRFLRSPEAVGLEGGDVEAIVDDLVWYRSDYGFGDPLRWSEPGVEILLLDWYPRKIVADAPYLAAMPQVLRRFIRFAHSQVGIGSRATDEVLARVDEFEPEYREAVSRPRRQGAEALLERMGALPPLDAGDDR